METREWSIDRNGRRYSIELRHNPAESFLDILVNTASVVVRPERRADGSTEYRFNIAGEPAAITARVSGQQYTYELKTTTAGKQGAETKVVTPVAMTPAPMPSAPQRAGEPTPGPRAIPVAPERATPLQAPIPIIADSGVSAPQVKAPSSRVMAIGAIVALLVVALGGIAFFVVKKQSEWSRYQDSALGFEVELPPGPVSRSQGGGWFALSGQQGDVELTKLSGLGASWEVGLMRSSGPVETEKVLQDAEEELRRSHTVTKLERFREGHAPGFEAEMMTRSGPGSLQVVVVGQRVYTVSVRAGFAVKPELRARFFESFKPVSE